MKVTKMTLPMMCLLLVISCEGSKQSYDADTWSEKYDAPVVYLKDGAILPGTSIKVVDVQLENNYFEVTFHNTSTAPSEFSFIPRYFDSEGREIVYSATEIKEQLQANEKKSVKIQRPYKTATQVGITQNERR